MKKRNYFISLLILFPIVFFGQILKNVDSFTKVTAYDQITVFLIPSTENKVEVSGFNAEKVELIIENEELKIKFPLEQETKGNDILAKVYFVKINAVEANGASNIGASAKISSPNFDIISKENSYVKLELNADKVTARVSQGSKLNLLGTIENFDVVASNSSKVFANQCQVKQAIVNANAGGEIEVNASELVDAKVRAGGIINIHGKPKKVLQKTILGGEILLQ